MLMEDDEQQTPQSIEGWRDMFDDVKQFLHDLQDYFRDAYVVEQGIGEVKGEHTQLGVGQVGLLYTVAHLREQRQQLLGSQLQQSTYQVFLDDFGQDNRVVAQQLVIAAMEELQHFLVEKREFGLSLFQVLLLFNCGVMLCQTQPQLVDAVGCLKVFMVKINSQYLDTALQHVEGHLMELH